jgi:hypothetical protein
MAAMMPPEQVAASAVCSLPRVARPGRVAEPAVPPRGLNLGAAGADAGQFARQLPSPSGDQPGPDGQGSGQAQARAPHVHAAEHAGGGITEQQVERYRSGVFSCRPVRIGVRAHYQPSVSPRWGFFHWSPVTNPGLGVVPRAHAEAGAVGGEATVRSG